MAVFYTFPLTTCDTTVPELPEVETVARTLAPLITGRCITSVELLNAGTVQGPVPLEALTSLCIDPVKPTSRRGKLLFVHVRPDCTISAFLGESAASTPVASSPTSSDSASSTPVISDHTVVGFAVHLKMTGRLFVHPAGTPPNAHTRVVLRLSDGTKLFFDDARKFGYLRVITAHSLHTWPFYQKLGPEPLDIDAACFAERFAGRRSTIKSLLLNQGCIAGCGNIYADEALFRAGIAPHTTAHSLTQGQLFALHRALQEVLRESIAACGSSIRDYRTANGDVGAFQNAFAVYNRGGLACVQCAGLLQKVQVAGRSTVYCPRCQH